MPTKARKPSMTITLEIEKPIHHDLVNNYKIFHEYNPPEKLLSFSTYTDDTKYGNQEHIDDFLKRDFTDEELTQTHIVQVPIDYIWSSDRTMVGGVGYNRVRDATVKNEAMNFKNLNAPNADGNRRGYVSDNAGMLHGKLRPNPDGTKRQVVMFCGNHRVVKKLIAHRGDVTNVVMSISFHELGLTPKKMGSIEAAIHSADAGDISGQNECQKFISDFRAGKSAAVECFEFLLENKINYDGIMQLEGIVGSEDWLSLTSIGGIKQGISNGYFKRYSKNAMSDALQSAKQMAVITTDTCVGMSPIESMAQMFHIFTNKGVKDKVTSKPMFARHGEKSLTKFFVTHAEVKNAPNPFMPTDKKGWRLRELSATGSIKCMVYIAAKEFWPNLTYYWQECSGSTQGIGSQNHALQEYLKLSKDSTLRKDAESHIIKTYSGK